MFTYAKDGIIVASMIDTRKPNSKGLYPIKIRVNQNRVRDYYSIGISISREEWEKLPSSKSTQGKATKEAVENSFSLVRANVEALAERGDFSFDALRCRLGQASGDSINNAMRAKIEVLKSEGRIGSMELYAQTLMLLEEFAGNDISFGTVTVAWLNRCEKHWSKTKNQTTIGMHMRNIRAIMNQARKAGFLKEAHYPFGKDRYEIKKGESHKKALNSSQIKQIFDYTDHLQATEKYKSLWLFIYMCNGINVADLVKLKYKDIEGDFLYFVRQKTENTTSTRKQIKVAVTSQMRDIISRWGNPVKPDNYIFSYLKGEESPQERKNITKDLTKRLNKHMNRIGNELGLGGITTYTARHSYATVLKRGGAGIAFISEAMGHCDLKTTEAYLASFEDVEYQKNAHLLTQFD